MPFHLFGPDHIAVLSVTFVLALVLVGVAHGLDSRIDRGSRLVGALALTVAGGSGWMMAVRAGVMVAPLNFCDFALFASIAALLTLRRWLCQISYFWGVGGSLQALLQPDISVPFPQFWWFQFFATHSGVMLAAVYLGATQRVQPTLKTAGWIWLLSNAYLVIILFINWRYGTNFGYLAEKPTHPSVLDYFGPWPYYIFAIEFIGVISLLILAIPFSSFRESLKFRRRYRNTG